MKMQMFATLDKANPHTGNIRGLNRGGGQAYDRSSDWIAVVAGATNNREFSALLNLN
jgi:hypothetical protein